MSAVCSALKTYELKVLIESDDRIFALAPLIVWTSAEYWIITIVGYVPPIRPHSALYRRKYPLRTGLRALATMRHAAATDLTNWAPSSYQSNTYGMQKAWRCSDEIWMELAMRGLKMTRGRISWVEGKMWL
ncbi:uncharacterized protein N7482_006796 [Penicillium canariense]|uniref:Uncharacterized protein n=1 Tax=Penicillium canariense TaxID=189055 RepID=A0A9W9HYF6_9EURO|nr:uncharacterized protein N7482_006796 [Penicillium canariense]KAJ5159792.1 hypothetical protein N7482_006796 [Penicillium canariense]